MLDLLYEDRRESTACGPPFFGVGLGLFLWWAFWSCLVLELGIVMKRRRWGRELRRKHSIIRGEVRTKGKN